MKKNNFLILLVLLFANIGLASSIQLPVPEVETLPNGLKVVWFLNDRLPILDFTLFFKVGFRDDFEKKTGISQLVMESLERGAAGLGAQQIAQSIEKLGASYSSSIEEDTAMMSMHGLSIDGMSLLELLAKLALTPEFSDSEVKREQERILDRWSHVADYGDALADLVYFKVMTAGTSYGRGRFFSKNEFKNISRNDVLNFYKKYFIPKNAFLVVVGRADKKIYKEKINSLFSSWVGDEPKKVYRNYADTRLGGAPLQGKTYVVHKSNATQAQVRIGFRSPLVKSPEHYPLAVANALLGGYFNSRLNSLIRDKLGLTYAISSAVTYSKDLGIFTIASSTRNEAVGTLIQKTMGVLEGLKQGPIPQEEVEMAKNYLTGGFPLSVSTLNAVAGRWVSGELFDLGSGYLNEFVTKVENVSASQILTAVNKVFKLDQASIVISGDSSKIEKSLKEAKYIKFKKVSAQSLIEHF